MIRRFLERIQDAVKPVHSRLRSFNWRDWFTPTRKIRYTYNPEIHDKAVGLAEEHVEKFIAQHERLITETADELSRARGQPTYEENANKERRRLTNESLKMLMTHHFSMGDQFDPETFNALVERRTGSGLTVGGVSIYDNATSVDKLAEALEKLHQNYLEQGKRLSLMDVIRVQGRAKYGGDQESLEHTRHQIALHTLLASHYGEKFAQRAMREIEDPKAALRLAESWLPEPAKLTPGMQQQLDVQRQQLVNLYEKTLGARGEDRLLRELKSPGTTNLKRHAVPLALAAAIVAGSYGKLQPSMQYNWDNFVRPGLHWVLGSEPEPAPTPSPTPRPSPTKPVTRATPSRPTPAPAQPQVNDLFMQEAAAAIKAGPASVLNITDHNTGINHQVALAAMSEYEAEKEGSLNLTDLRKALKSRHVNLLAAKEKGVKANKVVWSNPEKTEAPVYPNLKYVFERVGYRGQALKDVMAKYAERMRQLPASQGGWKPGKAPQGTVNTGPVTSGRWFRKFSRALARRKSA